MGIFAKAGTFLLFLFLIVSVASAGEIRVAVASNFVTTARVLAKEFSQQNNYRLLISFGSTGKLFTQISNGAPFDVFLSADVTRAKLLEEKGVAVAGSRFTYAIGKLTLWASGKSQQEKDCRAILRENKFRRLAIANPKTAPYGLAAQQTLQKMKLWNRLRTRLVRGENIGQTFHYVVTGNAQLGFVAVSQVRSVNQGLCRWDVPQTYHTPIEQQAVLLKKGVSNSAAQAFLGFLKSEIAKSIIKRAGYAV
ncbi:MAG TPA: molybdate ABC transporter substrate-binding protein [Gammaproteobacteria bacterium]|nr:molybdate ABC transporter substrate-binding protein [Gammaproteobacteria bacterium]